MLLSFIVTMLVVFGASLNLQTRLYRWRRVFSLQFK